jgi:RNA polymerase primary sigma factor
MTKTTPVIREKNSDKNPTKIYLKEVSKNKLLTHAQEIEYSQQIETAKKNLVSYLFEIPMCVRSFDAVMTEVISGTRECDSVFNIEENADKTLLTSVKKVQVEIAEYVLHNCTNQHLKSSIAEAISELPLKLGFLDQLFQPIMEVVKQTTATAGAFLRYAQSQGISRECFLENYQSSSPKLIWQKFLAAHAAQTQEFHEQLAGLNAHTGLTVQQLQQKIAQIKQEQKAKDQAVELMLKSNLRLVVSVAKKYINVSPTPLLDLVQEGNIGLLKAIEKYNWRLGFRFSTYATWWIKQCVLKALNEQHRIIKVPSHMTDMVKRVARAQEEFHGAHGYEPGVQEIARMLKVEEHVVARVWTVSQGTVSLETPIGSEEEQNLASVIEDVDHVNAFDRIAEVDTQNAMAQVLRELNPKEERVIRMRFGIGVDKESTLEDIGQVLGVTRERIRQIEFKALEKLKNPALAQRMQEAFE